MSGSFDQYQYRFTHVVDLSKFDKHIDVIFKRVNQLGVDNLARSLIPTFIHFNIANTSDVKTMRLFLKKMRTVQSRYFVRCTVPLLWAAESDNTDMFYSYSENIHKHTDVVFDINIISQRYVEIKIKIPYTKRSHLIIKEISRDFATLVNVPHSKNEDDTYRAIGHFHMTHNISKHVDQLNDDFHIIFIPQANSENYYPIPLLGLKAEDAERKAIACEKALMFMVESHNTILEEKPYTAEIINMLVRMIRDNEELGDRYKSAQTTYHLSELLFGYHILLSKEHTEFKNKKPSRHQCLMFELVTIEDVEFVEMYKLKVSDTSD